MKLIPYPYLNPITFYFFTAVCWIFPRNVLPHTELAPSSLPSPSPSMEKLKDSGKRQWHHTSSRSLHSENIYEVCSPPSPDSLYEEVGSCNPYGVVMVENAPYNNKNNAFSSRNVFNDGDGTNRNVFNDGDGSNFNSKNAFNNKREGERFQPIRNVSLPSSRFSTFGGSGAHGFVNPVVQEAQTLRSSGFRPRNAGGGYVQKRELPPVPGSNY